MRSEITNYAEMIGIIDEEPTYEYTSGGKAMYRSKLRVSRLSGAVDILPLIIPDHFLEKAVCGENVQIVGQLRSHNVFENGRNRLKLAVYANGMEKCDVSKSGVNDVRLEGFVCKQPVFRNTPLNREITDILLAVNREAGKTDYIPCVTWGKTAKMCARIAVGTRLELCGRFQSREYKKVTEDGTHTMTAYELSVAFAEAKESRIFPSTGMEKRAENQLP